MKQKKKLFWCDDKATEEQFAAGFRAMMKAGKLSRRHQQWNRKMEASSKNGKKKTQPAPYAKDCMDLSDARARLRNLQGCGHQKDGGSMAQAAG